MLAFTKDDASVIVAARLIYERHFEKREEDDPDD